MNQNGKVYIVTMYRLCMRSRTTIQIEGTTLDRIKKFKTTKRDTYDEILNRLMDLAEEMNKKTK